MRIVFLGTGTSSGVPAIGCRCAVCTSTDPRNSRRRTSLFVQAGETCILIDTSPDLRQQALDHGVDQVDAILMTHTHADHVFGFDDVRAFNMRGGPATPVFLSEDSLVDMRRIFNYVEKDDPGRYKPRIEFRVIDAVIDFNGVRIDPIEVLHEPMHTLGYRIDWDGNAVAYFPDVHRMPEEAYAKLAGLDVMILDSLRERPHYAHLTIEESLAILQRVAAPQSYMVHMNHEVDHQAIDDKLPAGINLAHDGLTLDL